VVPSPLNLDDLVPYRYSWRSGYLPRVSPLVSPWGVAAHGSHCKFTRAIAFSPGVCVADAAIAEVLYPGIVALQSATSAHSLPVQSLSVVWGWCKEVRDQTGLTHGMVVALNATLGPYTVNCVGGIYFNNVIVTNAMSQSGDSGSILLSNAGWGRWPSLWRFTNPGLDGKNGCGGKLLRTDRPVLTRLGVGLK
jgi:hypothetical protein